MPIGITVGVADLDDLTTVTDITDQLIGADGRVPHNGLDDGAVYVPHGETITPDPIGRAIVFAFDGTPAHAIVGEVTHTVELDEGEESKMVTAYRGDGLVSLLDRYIIRPDLDPGFAPWSRRRTFSAFSPEYADHLASPWEDAIEIATVGGVSARYTGLPSGFPHFQGIWVGVPGTDDLEAPIGRWWLLDDLVLVEDTVLIFFIAADNRCRFYVDGLEVLTVSNDRNARSGFAETSWVILSMSAGTHRVGAVITNPAPDNLDPPDGEGAVLEGNPTSFLGVAYDLDGRGALGAILWETSTDCRVLGFPTTPPGMTIPEICQLNIDENVADGMLPEFTLVTDGTFDEVESFTVDVGAPFLNVLRDQIAHVYADLYVPPDALELHLWPPEERATDPAPTVAYGPDVDPDIGNLRRLETVRLDAGTDCLLVGWEPGGYVRVPDSGGTRIAYLPSRAKSKREALALGAWHLAQPGQPTEVDADIAPTGAGDVPGTDYNNGDLITVGGYTDEKVWEWGFRWSTARSSEPVFDIVVAQKIPTDDSRLGRSMRSLLANDLGGLGGAAPAYEPPPFGSTINSGDVTFRPLPPYATGPADVEKRPVASGNLYAVAVTAKVAGSTDTDFEFLVNDTDVLGGLGTLPASDLFALIPVDPIVWVEGNASRLTVDLTAIGTDVDGLLFEPRFL